MQRNEETKFLKQISWKNYNEINWHEHPFSLPALSTFSKLHLHPNVTFIVGENGTGKSTLLEAIAVVAGFNAEGGTKNFAFSTYDSHSDLYKYLTLSKSGYRPTDGFFLRAESFYNVASEMERLDSYPKGGSKIKDSYGGKSLHEQSHGESFFSLFIHRFGGNGLYILDEPEAALSPMRQLSFLSILDDLVKNGSQFIIATHSPIILGYPISKIYEIKNEIKEVSYKETEHYQISRMFLENPDKILHHLLNEDK